jgi:hypothetical protein
MVPTLCQQTVINDSCSDSVFTATEAWLEEGKHRRAIKTFISDREVDEEYRSLMDFVYVSLFPHWREKCFLYYRGKGPQLRKQATPKMIRLMDQHILKVLTVCYMLWEQEQHIEWAATAEAWQIAASAPSS